MSDVTASYGTPCDFIALLGIFILYYLPIMPKLFYLHQKFADCVSNQ